MSEPFGPVPMSDPTPSKDGAPGVAKRKSHRALTFLGFVIVFILGIAIGASGSGSGTSTAAPAPTVTVTSDPAPQPTVTVTVTPAAPADAADPTTLSNNGWKIASFTAKDDGTGDFGAAARITNATGADVTGALFTITVLDSSKNVIATLNGSASAVASGATATVQFISTDKYKTGTFVYAFQVDGSY